MNCHVQKSRPKNGKNFWSKNKKRYLVLFELRSGKREFEKDN